MEIHYSSKKLEKLLQDKASLNKAYGQQAAKKINQRVSELQAADNITHVPPTARPHPLEPKNEGIFSVDILKHKHPLRLIFRATGKYDLSERQTITEITILEIKKTHS